ncbi:hypothetical protein [Parapedobacter tibetensis]|uniref:hypothetical protein n=1 Tax=Parapedobacter tibetensis TaxID=2972951 RepID=UPI00214D48E3|nr:hypothetical protein [Parapedobacter tibetensis]
MEVLITGLNNYLARNIAIFLAEEDYKVTCLVRNRNLFYKHVPDNYGITVTEGDMFRGALHPEISRDTRVAFYFNQSPANELDIRLEMERIALQRYINSLQDIACQHLIYVTKLVDDSVDLIDSYLHGSGLHYTIIRVSNIIGNGSILMNILSKLAKKNIIMVPKEFAENRCQPVHLLDVCAYLNHIMLDPRTYGESYDIGGPEIMTYREVFERYLQLAKLRKKIVPLPALGLSLATLVSRYLYKFEQDVSSAFIANMRSDLLCKKNGLDVLFPVELTPFDDAINRALGALESGHPMGK